MIRSFTSSPLRMLHHRCFSSSTTGVFGKIACIGGGMMAQAMMEPMIEKKLQPAERFMVYDVNIPVLDKIRAQHPTIQIASTVEDCVKDADLVLCAVKPQNMTPEFLGQLAASAPTRPNSIALSVIAGQNIDVFRSQAGFEKVVRSMPNTPATISAGMTVFATTNNLTVEERKKIEQVLSSCGTSVRIELTVP